MEIWKEPYTDKKYGKEPRASFKIFQQLLKQGYPYNKRILAEKIITKSNKKTTKKQQKTEDIQKKIQRKYNTIRGYSAKYKYTKRLDAYEKHLQELESKEMDRKLSKWKNKELDNAMNRVNYHNDRFEKIRDNNEMSELDKAIAEERNENSYGKSIDKVFQIAYGGVIKKESKNEVKGDIKVHEYGILSELFTEEELAEMREDLKNIDNIDEEIENLDDDFSKFE